jgi:flagellar basal-body rod protein FlgB
MSTSYIKLLEKFVDFTSARNKLISKNIANIDAKNYQRQDIKFSDVLKSNINSGMKRTERKHFTSSAPGEVLPEQFQFNSQEESNFGGARENNVDIDKEMTELSQNALMFKFATKKINGYFTSMQQVIKGG